MKIVNYNNVAGTWRWRLEDDEMSQRNVPIYNYTIFKNIHYERYNVEA